MRRDAAIVLVVLAMAAAGAVERLMRERAWDAELRRSVEAAIDDCEEDLAIARDTHSDRLMETLEGGPDR